MTKSALLFFEPGGHTVQALRGRTLLEASKKAEFYINASCNRKGSCGKCKLIMESGSVDSEKIALLSDREKEREICLSCQSRVKKDTVVKITRRDHCKEAENSRNGGSCYKLPVSALKAKKSFGE